MSATTREVNLFIASTLARAINWHRTSSELDAAEQEALQRWREPAKLAPPEFPKEFDVTLSCLLSKRKKLKKIDPRVVIPNRKACLERRGKAGGVARELDHQWQQRRLLVNRPEEYIPYDKKHVRDAANPWSVDQVLDLPRAERNKVLLARADHDAAWTPFRRLTAYLKRTGEPMSEALYNKFKAEMNQQFTPRTPQTLLLMSLSMLRENPVSRVKPVAIREKGGKIRTASIHPAYETHIARNIMERHIPILKRLGVCQVIRGQRVTLKMVADGQTFSADLSKATDRFGHDISQKIWVQWCRYLKEPLWVEESGVRLLGEKLTEDGQFTTCGIHMGLGISWIVLNLLNLHCARLAGINLRSTSVCGDDLVAHATLPEIQGYKDQLKRHGLEANESKEFIARNGVFCESILLPERPSTQSDTIPSAADDAVASEEDSPSKAKQKPTRYRDGALVSQPIQKLSELGATKYLGRFTKGRARAQDSIPDGVTKSTRWLAAKMRARLAARLPPGPTLYGGNGLAKLPSPPQIYRALTCGKIAKNPKMSKMSYELRQTLSVTRTPTATPFDLVRNLHYQLENYKGTDLGQELDDKKLRRAARPFNLPRRRSRKEWEDAIRENKHLSRSQKRLMRKKLLSGCQPTSRRFRKTLTALLDNTPTEYVESYDESLDITQRQSVLTSPLENGDPL
jgi:hypothetical protein